MSDWNLFVREARAGNFGGTWSLAMRYLLGIVEFSNEIFIGECGV